MPVAYIREEGEVMEWPAEGETKASEKTEAEGVT